MSAKTAARQVKENGRSVSPRERKSSSSSSTSTSAPYTNGHDRSTINASVCRDSDGDSSIADDSLTLTPTPRKFKVPSHRPRTDKSDKRRISSASFSHEHSRAVDLEREVRKLLAERNQLSKQLYTSKQENTKLEGKVQMAVRDKSALVSQMASLSKHNRDLSRGKSILLAKAYSAVDVRKTRTLEQSLKQANREKRAKQKELEKLNIQMNMTSKQMQEKLLASLDEREEMEIRIEDLECEVQHLMECNASSEEENKLLKENLASQEEACQDLRDRRAQLEHACQEKESELGSVRERLTQEKETLKHNLDTAQETILNLEQRVASLQEKVSESAQHATDLQTHLQSTQSELETERGVRERAEGELMDCRRQLNEVGEKVVSLEETVANSSQTNSDLKAQLESTQSELGAERDVRERAEGELTECRRQLSEVEEKVVTLEEKLAKSSQTNSDLEAQLTSLGAELQSERDQRKKAEETLTHTTTQLSDQKTELERVKTEHTAALESAHTKCSDLVSELEKVVREGREAQALLKTQLTAAEADHKKAVSTAEEMKKTEEQLTVQLRQLEKEKGELHVLQTSTLEQLEQAQEKLSALEDQVDGFSQEAAVAVQEKMTKELEEVQTKLVQQETHSTKMKNKMSARVQELEDELEQMQLEREQLEMAYLDLQEKCRPFQDQIEGLADVNALLQSQAALAKREAQEVSDQFASLVGHQNSRQKIRYVKKIRDENAALKMEMAQLRMELSKLKKQIRRMQNENNPGPVAAALAKTAKPLTSKN